MQYRNIAYVGLAYQTYKALADFQVISEKKKVTWTREVSEQSKQNELLLLKILLKWITSLLFFKMFWMVEWLLFFLPTSFVRLWIGFWIMLPGFSGEFFLFNLVSDRLEKFEYYVRLSRNWFVNRIILNSFKFAKKCYITLKPYLHTEFLRKCADIIHELDTIISKDLSMRKRIISDKDQTDNMMMSSSLNRSHLEDEAFKSFIGNDSTNQSMSTARPKASMKQQQQFTQSNTSIPSSRNTTSIKQQLTANHLKKIDASKKLLAKKNNDPQYTESFMDESFYSQIQEMDLIDDDYGIHQRAPTMSFIPNVEKSIDMLQQSTTARDKTKPLPLKTQMTDKKPVGRSGIDLSYSSQAAPIVQKRSATKKMD